MNEEVAAWDAQRKRCRQLESAIASKLTQLTHLTSKIGARTVPAPAPTPAPTPATGSYISSSGDVYGADPAASDMAFAKAETIQREIDDLLSKVSVTLSPLPLHLSLASSLLQ